MTFQGEFDGDSTSAAASMENTPIPSSEDHRLTLFIASSSIIILALITIIGVVSCFILCNEDREFVQEVTLDTPLREAYDNVMRALEGDMDDAAEAEAGDTEAEKKGGGGGEEDNGGDDIDEEEEEGGEDDEEGEDDVQDQTGEVAPNSSFCQSPSSSSLGARNQWEQNVRALSAPSVEPHMGGGSRGLPVILPILVEENMLSSPKKQSNDKQMSAPESQEHPNLTGVQSEDAQGQWPRSREHQRLDGPQVARNQEVKLRRIHGRGSPGRLKRDGRLSFSEWTQKSKENQFWAGVAKGMDHTGRYPDGPQGTVQGCNQVPGRSFGLNMPLSVRGICSPPGPILSPSTYFQQANNKPPTTFHPSFSTQLLRVTTADIQRSIVRPVTNKSRDISLDSLKPQQDYSSPLSETTTALEPIERGTRDNRPCHEPKLLQHQHQHHHPLGSCSRRPTTFAQANETGLQSAQGHSDKAKVNDGLAHLNLCTHCLDKLHCPASKLGNSFDERKKFFESLS